MGEGDRMVRDLARGGHATMDHALAASDIRIFGNVAGVGAVNGAAAGDGGTEEADAEEAMSLDEGGEDQSEEEDEAEEDGDQEASTSEGAEGPPLTKTP